MMQTRYQNYRNPFEEEVAVSMAITDQRVSRSVFVGDLSYFCTEIDLANLFRKYGKIVNIEIKRGRQGDSLMHGFVEYELDVSAQLAIHYLHGFKYMGRKMR
jgi:RNA recognition motif-containing protein